jgi:hypothetical protein
LNSNALFKNLSEFLPFANPLLFPKCAVIHYNEPISPTKQRAWKRIFPLKRRSNVKGIVFWEIVSTLRCENPECDCEIQTNYTDKRFLPLALLLAIIALPDLVLILFLKPCLFFLFLLWGWYVLFN